MKHNFLFNQSRDLNGGRTGVEATVTNRSLFRKALLFFAFILLPMTGWGATYKLIDSGKLNNTDFRLATTSLTNENYTVNSVSYTQCVALGSANQAMVGLYAQNKFVAYDTKTDAASVKIAVWNKNSSNKNLVIIVVPEGAAVSECVPETIQVKKTSGYEKSLSTTGRTTIYCSVSSTDIRFCQIEVNETGNALPKVGEAGYVVNHNLGRIAAESGKSSYLDGIEYVVSSNAKVLNTVETKIKTANTHYVKFTLATAAKLKLTTSSTTSYCVSKTKGDVASLVTPAANTPQDIDLTAGTWYINPNGSDVKITKIEFAAAAATHSVTYALNGGSGTTPTQADVAEGKKFTVANATGFTAPADQEFKCWNDGTNDVEAGSEYTMGTSDVTLTAQWKAAVAKFTVTYMDGTTEMGTESVDQGSHPTALKINTTKPLAIFNGWYKSSTFEGNPENLDTISTDITLYGKWTKQYATSIEAFSSSWSTELSDHNFAISSTNNVSYDGGSDSKPADKGLKIKQSGTTITFHVQANKRVTLTVGSLKGGASISVDGGANYTTLTGSNPLSTGASVVTKYDGTAERTYVIRTDGSDYNIIQSIVIGEITAASDDATLKSLKVNDVLIPGFAPATTTYSYGLPYKTTATPTVSAEKNDTKASDPVITQATSTTGTATVVVTAENGTTQKTYTINFFVKPKDGVCIVKASLDGKTTTTTGLYPGTTRRNIQEDGKLGSTGHYLGVSLQSGYTFEANDVVVLDVASTNSASAIYFNNTASATGCETVNRTIVSGENIFTMPSVSVGSDSLFIYRVDSKCNPKVSSLAVNRPMNPTLTAITFNGVSGTIDATNKTVTAQVPFTTDFDNMPIEYTILSNDNSKVTKAYSSATWVSGQKTLTLTDKDGDQTIYTITLSKAAASTDATLSDIKVSGTTIDGFNPNTIAYTYVREFGVDTIPTVTYTKNHAGATATDATVNNVVTITVTAEDGTTQKAYTITFTNKPQPAAVPTITTHPASHDYNDTEVIQPLTVEASVTDGGTLSYQWYKGEEAIVDAIAASYTPTEAGSYKVIVTNTLGTETANATSNVAFITITHIYTFASWESPAASFTQTGNWTIYSANSDGVIIEDTKFQADQRADNTDKTIVANALVDRRFIVKFEKDAKQINFRAYAGNNNRSLKFLKVADVAQKNAYTDLSSSYTLTTESLATDRDYNYTIEGHFEAGKYYFIEVNNGTINMFDFFFTESAIVSGPTASIVSGTINGEAFSESEIATLNSTKALTLTTKFVAEPEIQLIQHTVTTYDDEFVKTIKDTVDAVVTTVGTDYIATCTFGAQDYVITCPINTDPALELTLSSGTAAISGKTNRSKSFETSLSGINLADGQYNVTVPNVEGLTVTPATFTVTDGKVAEDFTITYASDADVAENTVNIDFTVGALTTSFALTYSSVAWVDYTLQDVTGDMTWDFTNKAAAEGDVSSTTKGTYTVLANTNIKSTFANAQYMAADYNKYTAKAIQATGIKIHTTIPGKLTVQFAQTGSNKVRELYLNGEATGIIPSKNDTTIDLYVKAGDVVLTAWDAGESKWQMFNYAKFTFTASTEIRNGLYDGKFVTMCQAKQVTHIFGATAFEVEKKYSVGIMLVAAEMPLTAGKPYLLLANQADVRVLYSDEDAATEVAEANGLIGNLSTAAAKIYVEGDNSYVFQNNHMCKANSTNFAAPDRAYLNYNDVEDLSAQNAPTRRRIAMGGAEAQTTTGLDVMNAENGIQKMIINNQMIIIRDGKMFNAQGAVVR